MFPNELMIDGILCWRDTPGGSWTPYTREQLSEMAWDVKERLKVFENKQEETKSAKDFPPHLYNVTIQRTEHRHHMFKVWAGSQEEAECEVFGGELLDFNWRNTTLYDATEETTSVRLAATRTDSTD